MSPEHRADDTDGETTGEKSRVAITGTGMISPLGDDLSTFYRALLDGESGLAPLEAFDHDLLRVRTAGAVSFDPRQRFAGRNFRPVDRTGQLTLIAAEQALQTSGLVPSAEDENNAEDGNAANAPNIGLVLGTMFGSIRTIAAFDRRGLEAGPKYVKPLDFANSVINAAAGQTAIWHGLRGTNTTVAGGTTAGIQALGQGYEQIRAGRSDAILAGGAEELCFESFYGFQQAGAMAGSDPEGIHAAATGHEPHARPYDARRHGFLLGEGAALLSLERAERAEQRNASILGWISGHATFFDTSRGKDPERGARALERAIRRALDDAGLEPGEIDAVSAGGSGGLRTDLHEAAGLGRVFGSQEASRTVPVMAVKGQTGECLGASGAFQALAMLGAMKTAELPEIAGLGVVDPAIAASGLDFGPGPRRKEVRRGLLTGVGLDGQVCALVIERPS